MPKLDKEHLVVVGIGQAMRGDDGAGPAAVKFWQSKYPLTAIHPRVNVSVVETPGLGLADLLEGAQYAMIVDAVYSGKTVGSVQLVEESQLESFSSGTGSAHGFGVAETLSLIRAIDPEKLPGHLILLGIEAGEFIIGSGLSRQVEQALPVAAALIEEFISRYLSASTPS